VVLAARIARATYDAVTGNAKFLFQNDSADRFKMFVTCLRLEIDRSNVKNVDNLWWVEIWMPARDETN
jgi:hypothetical protein